MQTYKNFKFDVSLSKEAFDNKEIAKAMVGSINKKPEYGKVRKKYGYKRGVSFLETTLTSEELLDCLLKGHCFCHIFKLSDSERRKDGTFGASMKKNVKFKSAQVIGIDVDHTKYKCAEDYVAKLSLQPTFYYTSYRNLQEGQGARFRLMYVLDQKIESVYMFRFVANKIISLIGSDTGEIGKDEHGDEYIDSASNRAVQYFNGTCINNPNSIISKGITNIIYSLKDFGVKSHNEYVDYLINFCDYSSYDKEREKEKVIAIGKELKAHTNQEYSFNRKAMKFEHVSVYEPDEDLDIFDDFSLHFRDYLPDYDSTTEAALSQWDKYITDKNYTKFKRCAAWNQLRSRCRYFFRKEKQYWEKGLYQIIEADYFALKHYLQIQKDGDKRRKKIYNRMCLRRIMYPRISKTHILCNALIDIMKYFDNSDGVLDSSFLKRSVSTCFSISIEELQEQCGEYIKLRQGRNPKKGIIYKNRKAYCRETTYLIIDDYYNPILSIKENLAFINSQIPKFTISQSTLSRYCKDRGFKTDVKKLTDNELVNMIDLNLSGRKNYYFIKKAGYKISLRRVQDMITLMKCA